MADDAPAAGRSLPKFPGGGVPAVCLLYGDEPFLIEEALDGIVSAAIGHEDRALNLDVLSGAEAEGPEITARAASFPMTGSRRVVVVREADRLSAQDGEILAAYVREPAPSGCLVLVGAKPDMRKKPFAAIRKSGFALECSRLREAEIPPWITQQVHRGGRRIAPEAAKLLAAYVGTSLGEIAGAIDKLLLYIGDRGEIRPSDVSALVGMSREYSVFELQKAIGRRESGSALRILEETLNAGGGVPLIVATLSNFFITLWKLHALEGLRLQKGELASRVRVPWSYLGEYLEALPRHPPRSCERALLLLAEADERSKSGLIGAPEVMRELVLRLCGEGERNIPGTP